MKLLVKQQLECSHSGWKRSGVRQLMHRPLFLATTLLLALLSFAPLARGQARDRFFLSSDGVRLHYLEAGPATAHTLVFVPGWTMPAWIWAPQIQAFAQQYHVVAFDPRGQGDSGVPAGGYEPSRRGRDIAELIAHLDPVPVVVIAWSLGVLDTLASIHTQGDRLLAGLVLVDNSVGEDPPPPYHPLPRRLGPPPPRAQAMRQFVRAMFRHAPSASYLYQLTASCLRTPEAASRSLLAYPVPRSYWKEAIYATRVPVLYAVRPRWVAQGQNLVRNRPDTEMEVFSDAGHALFVDDPARFDRVIDSFLRRRVWP
jgi:non-heme chloroperoxidase